MANVALLREKQEGIVVVAAECRVVPLPLLLTSCVDGLVDVVDNDGVRPGDALDGITGNGLLERIVEIYAWGDEPHM